MTAVREMAALMVATSTPETRARLDELLDIKYPQPSLPALRFESIVAFAYGDSGIEDSRTIEEQDLVHADTRFKQFASEFPDLGVEMFGRKWEWAGGGLECLYSVRRQNGVDVMRLAKEAFDRGSPQVSLR